MIDKSKIYRTRDGHKVHIYATDGGGPYPIHGAIRGFNFWQPSSWTKFGSYREHFEDHEYDLIEVRPRHKRTVWLNVYGNHVYGTDDRYGADVAADTYNRIACIKVELDFAEGDGL